MGKHWICWIVVFFCFCQAYAGDNRWTSNGPYGGTFLTIAFDPQSRSTLYISGGDRIFRSRNNGQTYEGLDIVGAGEGFPAAFTIRFEPHSKTRMVAAGISIFASSNQGINWEELSHSPAAGDPFFDIEFHPDNAQVLYGVTYRRGILRSGDGGRTWTAKNSGLNVKPKSSCCDFPQLEVDPSNGSIVYALLSSRNLYKSTNGGDSWKLVSGLKLPSQVNSLSIDQRNPQTLFAGGFDGVFKSTNGGSTWTNTNCCGVFSIALDPKNTQTIYAVAGELYKSTSGGSSWVQLPAPIPEGGSWLGIAAHPASNLLIGTGFGNGAFRSMDGGRTWKESVSRLDDIFVENVDSSPQRPAQLYATQESLIFSSATGGNSWSLVKSLNLNPQSLDVHPANANLVAAAGKTAGFALSTDGGRTWTNRGPYSSVRQFCTECVQFHTQDQNTIYLAPLGAGMARTTDRGATWSAINAGLTDKNVSFITVDPRNGANLLVGTSAGRFFRSTNGGAIWKNSSAGIQSGYALAAAFDPGNSNILYAAVDRQPNKGFVYKSTNSGQNWIQKSRGIDPLYAIRAFAFDPMSSSTVFAAGEAGIFVSADDGENWSAFDSTGLSPFYLFDIQINSANPNTLFLGTDRGVYSYTRKTASGAPLIAQISPAAAKVGDTIVIRGSNFGAAQGGSSLSFNGTSGGMAAAWSSGSISARVPAGARSGPVTATVNGRRSNPFAFQVLATSGNVEPSAGPAAGGTFVTIIGPSATSTALSVLFGKTLAKNVRFTPPNIYSCTSPPGSGTVDVRVINGAVVATAGRYTYQ